MLVVGEPRVMMVRPWRLYRNYKYYNAVIAPRSWWRSRQEHKDHRLVRVNLLGVDAGGLPIQLLRCQIQRESEQPRQQSTGRSVSVLTVWSTVRLVCAALGYTIFFPTKASHIVRLNKFQAFNSIFMKS